MKAELNPEELNLIKLSSDYHDEDSARALLESIRWPNGPVCPHCQSTEKPYQLIPRATSKRPGRRGLYKCRERKCRKQFTVTVDTIFEDSHVSISTWLKAIFIVCGSKKSISSHQLHRMLGCTYKTAWFLTHRLRHAMHPEQPLGKLLTGTVEIDETYVGGKPRTGEPRKRGRGTLKKTPVVALIERNGNVRAKVIPNVNIKNLRNFIGANVDRNAIVNTDNFAPYHNVLYRWPRHDVVVHNQREYARHNPDGTMSGVNSCESFFSLLKRGVMGAWHNVSKEHLPKYVSEFAFRWNNRKISDGERMVEAIKITGGKRLLYKDPVPKHNH